MIESKHHAEERDMRPCQIAHWTLLLAVLLVVGAGCTATGSHMIDTENRPLPSFESLWEVVDGALPGALPVTVTVELIDGPHAAFDIERNAIMVSKFLRSDVARGKICMELTHLALHRLSGGDRTRRGRCFDNDKRFLEYALAVYMDRTQAGSLNNELREAYPLAARLFERKELSLDLLRDWDAFCYRGLWADQYREWNLDGLQVLVTLGHFVFQEKMWTWQDMSRVFGELSVPGTTLDGAFAKVLGADLDIALREWELLVRERGARMKALDETRSDDEP